MALIKVSNELVKDEEMFNIILESFETIEEVENNSWDRTRTLRVQHEEITKEDVLIDPSFIRFDGVRPFVIEWSS